MRLLALVLLLMTVGMGYFAFGDPRATATGVAKYLFFTFLALFCLVLFGGILRRSKRGNEP